MTGHVTNDKPTSHHNPEKSEIRLLQSVKSKSMETMLLYYATGWIRSGLLIKDDRLNILA